MQMKTLATLAGLAIVTMLAGCSTDGSMQMFSSDYGMRRDAGYTLPTIPISKLDRKFHRQVVRYETKEVPGTIVVDTKSKFLYLVQPGGKAMRYGIGVGKQGFEWNGTARIAMKREWPVWTPPAAMIKRRPDLAKYRDGMQPGIDNALGARALYLFNKNGDTGYRLHGTPEWFSIGKAMSSGCIRLINQDIIDLHNRAEVGAKVIVM
ncbi:L,D-transpeptidase family protein [Mesorhizobium sp. NBSH29]|uniref:L,D-transpeptidase n=1 Tax=Mesorhizobium sp. NBSH29 TaxID=2654249 RepID=UPI0018967085|nr:L,D-transpeptidase [Mesorhizobium sp. NBSH29]QPC86299.1 L,D-transpeptidase family protein [Mesorhizobium sp. NBSH29]